MKWSKAWRDAGYTPLTVGLIVLAFGIMFLAVALPR